MSRHAACGGVFYGKNFFRVFCNLFRIRTSYKCKYLKRKAKKYENKEYEKQ